MNKIRNKNLIISALTFVVLSGLPIISANAQVPTLRPTMTLVASPNPVPVGGSSILTWTSANTTRCVSSNKWTSNTATSGSQSIIATTTRIYAMSCSGPGGSVAKQVTISVGGTSTTLRPTMTLTASPTSIQRGSSSTLTWTSTNTTRCVSSGNWTSSTATSGSQSIMATTTKVYAISCSGSGGSIAKQVTVTVTGTSTPPTPPTLTFTASPTTILQGATSTLSWISASTLSCTASNGWTGNKTLTGSQIVSPTATTTYELSCTGVGGSISKQATIAVTVPPPPNPELFNEGMVTVSLDDSWISQYVTALPILDDADIKATFYITTQPIIEGWLDFMTPLQVRNIAQRGHEVGNHTITHPHLLELSAVDISKEIIDAKTYLQGLTGMSVTTFAHPYGEFNDNIKDLVRTSGHLTARGIGQVNLNTRLTDKYDLNSSCILRDTSFTDIKAKIDEAIAQKRWYILCIHEVKTGGTEFSITPTQFQEIVNYIKSSGVKTVTIKEGTALMN